MIKIVPKISPATTSAEYQLSGVKKIRISNNLSTLDVVGQLGDNDMLSTLRSATIASNIVQLSPSCFAGCGNLVKVSSDEKCQYYEDYAFYGCSSLIDINSLRTGGPTLRKIGTRCFYGCKGLEQVELNLAGNPDNLYEILGNECFANCTNMTDIKWNGSAYVSPRMLSGCSELTGITLANKAGYLYPYGFSGLESLESITIPNKTWIMNDNLFENCPNLSSVVFEDGDTEDTSATVEHFGNEVFKDCDSLEEITLPRSITSFSQLGDAMLAGSSILTVRFQGIPPETFGPPVPVKLKWSTGKWYYANEKPNDSNQTKVLKILKYAYENRIPIVVVLVASSSFSCEDCAQWRNDIRPTLKLNKNYFFAISYQWARLDDKIITWIKEKFPDVKIDFDSLPNVILLWNNEQSPVQENLTNANTNNKVNTNKKFNETLDKLFDGYVPPMTIEHEIDETSNGVTLLGRNIYEKPEDYVSCTYIASDGSERIVRPNGEIKYIPEVVGDSFSTINFKTGIWYGIPKELKEFADKWHIPVLIEYSSKGCTPCEYWHDNTYKNSDFQKWVRKQNFLFCRVEKKNAAETWNDSVNYPNLYNVEYGWVKAREAGFPYPPIFCWYWAKEDGTEVHDISSYHYNAGSPPPWTLEEFYDMTSGKFGSFKPNAATMSPPEISDVMDKENTRPVFRYYQNQMLSDLPPQICADLKEYDLQYLTTDPFLSNYISAWNYKHDEEDWLDETTAKEQIKNEVYKGEIDPNGVFFPCEKKEKLDRCEKNMTLTMDGKNYNVWPEVGKDAKDMEKPDEVLPDMTYQVFDSDIIYRYDKTSYIFRVRDGKYEYLFRGSNYLDSESFKVGFPTSQWVVPQYPSDVQRFIEQIEGQQQFTAILLASSRDDISNVGGKEFDDYVAGSGFMWLKVVFSDGKELTESGTVANELYKFLKRSYIKWSGGEDRPCIYLYKACASCSVGDPVPYVQTVFSTKNMSSAQIISKIKQSNQG